MENTVSSAVDTASSAVDTAVDTAVGTVSRSWRELLNLRISNFSLGGLLSAIVIFIICHLIIKGIMHIIGKLIDKLIPINTLSALLKSVIKIILYFISAIIAADTAGIPVTSLVAVFSLAGLAISLSLQSSLTNLTSGFTLMATKPFKEGDFVETASISGTVNEIGLFHTKFHTIDNRVVFIPNSDLTQSLITNYTYEPMRRIDLEISASYDADVKTVEKVLYDAARETEGIECDPVDVFTNVWKYDTSSVVYLIRAWTKTENYWDSYFRLMRNVKYAFDKNGIEMTYDHLNVHMVNK